MKHDSIQYVSIFQYVPISIFVFGQIVMGLIISDDSTYRDESSDSISERRATSPISKKPFGRTLSTMSAPISSASSKGDIYNTLTIPVPNLHEKRKKKSHPDKSKYLNVPRDV